MSCSNHRRILVSVLALTLVAVVAGSGNNNFSNGMAAPACVGSAISVGMTDDLDNVNIGINGSNPSPELDLLAPGVNIVSATIGNGTTQMTGTSQAAPHVAGRLPFGET